MENKKIKSISEISCGDRLIDAVYVLKSLAKEAEQVRLSLSDKTGILECYMPLSRYDLSYDSMVGGAVKVNGLVEIGKNRQLLGKVRSLAIADAGSFKVEDLFDGLSDEKKALYVNGIKGLINNIPEPSCRQLCSVILSDDFLNELSAYPASLAYHAKYRGGALATTYLVAKMVIHNAKIYSQFNPEMYESRINWSLLVTSSLLMYSAIPDYFIDNPWRKSQVAIDRGYMSLLQSKIEKAVYENNVTLSDERLARILNILGSSVALKTAVKATCFEGITLRNTLIAYEEMDMFDAEVSRHELSEGESYFFDGRLKRHIATNIIEEVA